MRHPEAPRLFQRGEGSRAQILFRFQSLDDGFGFCRRPALVCDFSETNLRAGWYGPTKVGLVGPIHAFHLELRTGTLRHFVVLVDRGCELLDVRKGRETVDWRGDDDRILLVGGAGDADVGLNSPT